MTLNVLQLEDSQVEALQSMAEHGLPYVIAQLEQCCIAEVNTYLKHNTDFDEMNAIIENYQQLIDKARETKRLVCNE